MLVLFRKRVKEVEQGLQPLVETIVTKTGDQALLGNFARGAVLLPVPINCDEKSFVLGQV